VVEDSLIKLGALCAKAKLLEHDLDKLHSIMKEDKSEIHLKKIWCIKELMASAELAEEMLCRFNDKL
jgi:hypothetical protein